HPAHRTAVAGTPASAPDRHASDQIRRWPDRGRYGRLLSRPTEQVVGSRPRREGGYREGFHALIVPGFREVWRRRAHSCVLIFGARRNEAPPIPLQALALTKPVSRPLSLLGRRVLSGAIGVPKEEAHGATNQNVHAGRGIERTARLERGADRTAAETRRRRRRPFPALPDRRRTGPGRRPVERAAIIGAARA